MNFAHGIDVAQTYAKPMMTDLHFWSNATAFVHADHNKLTGGFGWDGTLIEAIDEHDCFKSCRFSKKR
jgi:hypothetical protein